MNANNIFSLAVRTLAAVEHPLIKRANLGFALKQPFSWSLINSAAVFAQLPVAEQRGERGDQLKVKLASLRYFNRQVGDNEIGMGVIRTCLKPDENEVSLDEIKVIAQDRVKMERRSGKLMPAQVKARYKQLSTNMYEEACAKKRALSALIDEVFFICNRSDEELNTPPEGESESGAAHKHMITTEFATHFVYQDEELVDFDQYAHLLDGLLDKCVQPVIRAREELQRVLDRSYRVGVCEDGAKLMSELEHLGKELGINWKKLSDENARIDAELVAAEASINEDEATLDDVFAEADAEFTEALSEAQAPIVIRTTIKSPERLAREEAERAAAVEKDEYQRKMAERAAKAAATKARNAAAHA